jgi:hypothetical protein
MASKFIPLSFSRSLFAGDGYIAGELPAGLVTVNSAPGKREIEVRHRASRQVVAWGFSAHDGTYVFHNLRRGTDAAPERYDVIGRDWSASYNDVIVSRVRPALQGS